MSDEIPSCAGHLVHQVLPAAVTRAVDHYTDFSTRLPPDSAKDFSGFHTACKAAISHIAALLKLEKLCGTSFVTSNLSLDIETLLRETRQNLLSMEKHERDR